MITIQEVYSQVKEMAAKIGATAELFPTFGTSDLSGRPYIVIKGDTYYYLVNDKETVTIKRQTGQLPELLYWVFDDITARMGAAYEVEHRVPDVDRRRLTFKKQLDLLETLQPDWKDLKQREIQEILAKHPYRDELRT